MSAPVGDSIRRRRWAARRPPAGPAPPLRWARIALFGFLGAAAAFGVGYALAALVLFPAPAEAAPGIIVPQLVGQDTLAALNALAARGLRLGTVTAVPDPDAAVGTVIAQDALAGQQLRRGATVNLAVSSGPARALLPNVGGYAAARAVALLGALGFQVTQEVAPDSARAGRVVRMSPAPGLEYDLPANVLLTVSSGPPPDTTSFPDSTAVPDTGQVVPPAAGTPGLPGATGAGGAHVPPAAASPRPAVRDTARRGARGDLPRPRLPDHG